MGSSWIQVGPQSKNTVLRRREGEGGDLQMKAEAEAMCL